MIYYSTKQVNMFIIIANKASESKPLKQQVNRIVRLSYTKFIYGTICSNFDLPQMSTNNSAKF